MKEKNIKTYNLKDNFKSIIIDLYTADVEIKKSEDKKTKVVCIERKRLAHSVTIEDNTLIINRGKRKWYTYLLPSFMIPKIKIYVPKMDLDDLSVKCNTGSVEIECIDFNKDITIKGNTGKIKLSDMTCKSLTIKDGTGKVELENVIIKDKLNIKTNTGKVQINDSDAEEIFVKTNTGSIKGRLLTNKAFIIRCKTAKVSIPKTFSNKKCEIITNTGSINFEEKN